MLQNEYVALSHFHFVKVALGDRLPVPLLFKNRITTDSQHNSTILISDVPQLSQMLLRQQVKLREGQIVHYC